MDIPVKGERPGNRVPHGKHEARLAPLVKDQGLFPEARRVMVSPEDLLTVLVQLRWLLCLLRRKERVVD